MEIESRRGDAAYLELLETLTYDYGKWSRVSPRGQGTRELLDVTVRIDEPLAAPPLWVRKKFNLRIAAVETVQLIAGVSHLGQLAAVSGDAFTHFADDGRLRGAYGPRLYDQFPRAERQLRDDPDTRQAIVNLWRPDEKTTKDVPCTLSLTFRVRDGKLGLKVHMRSNDVILGVPYDWFAFSRVQLLMAEVLDLEPGPYVHHVDSLHLYERDLERAQGLIDAADELPRALERREAPTFSMTTVPSFAAVPVFPNQRRFTTWRWAQAMAWYVLKADEFSNPNGWYGTRVPPLESNLTPCTRCRYVEPLEALKIDRCNVDLVCEECRA
jgi:thymidylate synthase